MSIRLPSGSTDSVVEGPVELSNGMQAFLFIEPVDVDGAYYGEIAVGLKAEYVIDQLDLSMLEDEGYLYELWAVQPSGRSQKTSSPFRTGA